MLDLDDEAVPRPTIDGADDAGGHGPDGGAEGDREVDTVVVPSPPRDRVPSPAKRGADRTAGGPSHEGWRSASDSRRCALARGLVGRRGDRLSRRVLSGAVAPCESREHGRRALGGRAASPSFGARERRREREAENGCLGGEAESSGGGAGEGEHGAS